MKINDLLNETFNVGLKRKFHRRRLRDAAKFKKTAEFALYYSPQIDAATISQFMDTFNMGHMESDPTNPSSTKKIITNLVQHLKELGIQSKLVSGIFKTDLPNYWSEKFTPSMKKEMISNGLNPDHDITREMFIKENHPKVNFKLHPHFWCELKTGGIIDPTVGIFTDYLQKDITNDNYVAKK